MSKCKLQKKIKTFLPRIINVPDQLKKLITAIYIKSLKNNDEKVIDLLEKYVLTDYYK